MGVVYLAWNKLMGRPEVLKVVGGHLLEHPGVRERFLREIQAAAKLQHKNIVNAYSAMRLGANIVLTMEYVDGDDLAKVVRSDGPLPVANACYIIYQAALGLQHAHERGMVHRDIKPANLILGREGTKAVVKVLDFGLAKVTSEGPSDTSLTRHGQTMGTPDFIAPEQIRNSRSADIRADIYSLGCTFYAILTGGPPFRSQHVWDVYQAHFSMNAEPLNLVRPEVPVELAALVAKMMAKAPARRFQTPAEVAQAILPFLQQALGGSVASNAQAAQVGQQGTRRKPDEDRPISAQSATNSAAVPAPAIKNQTAAGPPEPSWESLIKFKETEPLRGSPVAARLRWLWPAAAVGTVLLGLAVVLAVVITVKTPIGVIVLENCGSWVERCCRDRWWIGFSIVTPAADQSVTIEIKPGKHGVVVKQGSEVFLADGVTLDAGKRFKLRVGPTRPPARKGSPPSGHSAN